MSLYDWVTLCGKCRWGRLRVVPREENNVLRKSCAKKNYWRASQSPPCFFKPAAAEDGPSTSRSSLSHTQARQVDVEEEGTDHSSGGEEEGRERTTLQSSQGETSQTTGGETMTQKCKLIGRKWGRSHVKIKMWTCWQCKQQRGFSSKMHFKRKLSNGECVPRGWLCYSLSAGHVFCLHAKYLARTRKSQQFVSGGYFDWKHANDCIAEHESCDIHRKAMIA